MAKKPLVTGTGRIVQPLWMIFLGLIVYSSLLGGMAFVAWCAANPPQAKGAPK